MGNNNSTMSNNNNNNNDNQTANEPPQPEDDGRAVAEGGEAVRVSSSDDAANSSGCPESTEQEGESPSHGSSDAGSKTGRGHTGDHDDEGGVEDGVGDRDDDAAQEEPPEKVLSKPSDFCPHPRHVRLYKHSRDPTERDPSFPVKLHRILSKLEHEDIIAWLPHGLSWRINNSKRFEDEVLPLYFRHGRYSSFARQVNGWGFKRVMQGSDYNSYYHELFIRSVPHLCERMKRLNKKDIVMRKMESSTVPDFDSLNRDQPLPDSTDGTADDGNQAPLASVVTAADAASAWSGQAVRRQVSRTPSGVNALQSVPRKMPTIPENVLKMQAELEMLEKRRKEIVDRIDFLSASLGRSNPSDNDPNPAATAAYSNGPGLDASGGGGGHLGNQAASATAAAASQPFGDGIGALTQQGMLALLRQPGGAQLLTQLAHGLQNNGRNNNESQARSVPPPAFNQNHLLSMPGGIQLIQHFMSSNKSNSSQGLQVNSPAPVAYNAAQIAPQMGEAHMLLERLMQVINNSSTQAPSSMQVTSPPVQVLHLSPPPAAPAPAGLPAAILQMFSAQQAPPTTAIHGSNNNHNFGANGTNAVLFHMLTTAMGQSNAAAAAATPSAPPPPAPVQPIFVVPSPTTGQNNNVPDAAAAAAMMQQLLQNGKL